MKTKNAEKESTKTEQSKKRRNKLTQTRGGEISGRQEKKQKRDTLRATGVRDGQAKPQTPEGPERRNPEPDGGSLARHEANTRPRDPGQRRGRAAKRGRDINERLCVSKGNRVISSGQAERPRTLLPSERLPAFPSKGQSDLSEIFLDGFADRTRKENLSKGAGV